MKTEAIINGEVYVLKSSVGLSKPAKELKGLKYVLIRTYSAGVHVGYLKNKKDNEVTLLNSRRIYYWDGAATLSQLAKEGVSKPENCKFPCEVDEITLLNVIEIIPMTEKSRLSVSAVKVWTQ